MDRNPFEITSLFHKFSNFKQAASNFNRPILIPKAHNPIIFQTEYVLFEWFRRVKTEVLPRRRKIEENPV